MNVEEIRAVLKRGNPIATYFYDGEFAAVVWPTGDGWALRVGSQGLSGDDATVDSIEWIGDYPEFFSTEEAAMRAFCRETGINYRPIVVAARWAAQHGRDYRGPEWAEHWRSWSEIPAAWDAITIRLSDAIELTVIEEDERGGWTLVRSAGDTRTVVTGGETSDAEAIRTALNRELAWMIWMEKDDD